MDEGPFRSSRQSAAEDEPVPKPVEQPKKTYAEPKPVHRSSSQTLNDEKPKKLLIGLIIGVVVIVVVAVIAWVVIAMAGQSNKLGIDSNKYQAVSFTDGQLYFGKLTIVDDEHMKLTDVFYLQPQSEDGSTSNAKDLQKAESGQSNFKLAKFTDVVYGPEDEMIIPKGQILFFENIKSDGKLAKLIEQFKNPN